jgi:hypothetical protein
MKGTAALSPADESTIDQNGDPRFGEREFGEHPKSAATVEVRRKLKDYSQLDEVFVFYAMEPQVSEVELNGLASVEYKITKEFRSGKPGISDPEYSTAMPIGQVPEEVIDRAEQMADFITFRTNDD